MREIAGKTVNVTGGAHAFDRAPQPDPDALRLARRVADAVRQADGGIAVPDGIRSTRRSSAWLASRRHSEIPRPSAFPVRWAPPSDS